jgi:ribosomal protein S18 acetylase RimI-like enzyme
MSKTIMNMARKHVTQPSIVVVDYIPSHAHELVRMWRDSFERALGIVDPHPLAEQQQYLEELVVAENRVHVVLDESTSTIVGFMAATPKKISQLYVHVNHQNQGIGSLLINLAKQQSCGRLRLFTFKVNENAQRFYERHGFKVVGRGFEEEWQLEDIEYEWTV